MKRLFIAAWICLAPLAYADTAPASQPRATVPNPAMSNAVYLYSKAVYLHDVMIIRYCDQINASAVNAIDERLANARTKMFTIYGKSVFRHSPPTSTGMGGECDEGMISNYGDHVADLEKFLSSAS